MPVISARFTGSKLVGRDFQLWVQLVDEFGAALRLVGLADRLGGCAQAVERTQESAVGLVPPAHVARAAPSRLPQPVEPAVIADTEVRVRLDVVASEPTELRPRIADSGASARTRRRRRRAGPPPASRARRAALRARRRIREASTVSGIPPGEKPMSVITAGWYGTTGPSVSLTGWRTTDARRPRSRSRRPGSCWCGTRSPRTPVRCCRAGCPESTCPTRASVRPTPTAQRLAKLPIAAVYASPIERTTQTAKQIAAHHGIEVHRAPRCHRSRLRRLDRRQDRGARQDRRVEGRAGRAVACEVPERRDDSGDAVAHGRRARRGRCAPSPRDGGRGEPRRPDQVGDRALQRHASRPVPARACVARVRHGVRLPHLRRDDGEVQRHRRPRRPASRTREREARDRS